MRTIWSVLGNSQRLDGGAMYGNAPRAVWERWSPPDAAHRIPLACRCLLVREDDRWILCEAGIGVFFSPELRDRYGVVEPEHRLVDGLAALGISPSDIDVVVLSHLHFDHAGGLLSAWSADEPLRLLFDRARFVVSEAAWERACQPHARDRASYIPELVTLLADSGRLELVDVDADGRLRSPSLPGWRFHLSEGHTPGLLLAEIPMPDGPVLFCGDLIPGTPWVHLPITMGYDRFPERLIDEKSVLLQDLAARGGRLFYTHDPAVAMSGVGQEKGRFRAIHPVATVDGVVA